MKKTSWILVMLLLFLNLLPMNTKSVCAATDVTKIVEGFSSYYGVAVDSSETYIYYTGSSSLCVTGGTSGAIARDVFNGARGVAVDSSGNIYVADSYNNAIKKVDGNNNVTNFRTGIPEPRDVAVDGSGYVYFVDSYSNAIVKLNSSGYIVDAWQGAPYNFNRPMGVAVDSSGNIYVSDCGNDAIKKINPSGQVTTIATGFDALRGIGVDSRGNVYVAEWSQNVIKKINPSGQVATIATGFYRPEGLAVQSSAADVVTIYVADSYNQCIKKITMTLEAPTIITPPADLTAIAGQAASFNVVATGTEPLSYQWKKDGSSISGATSPTLNIANAQAGDVGSYTVEVSNEMGAVTSNAATLTVQLAKPAKPLLTDGIATWTAVDNEDNGYSLQLYKDGEVEGAAVDIAHSADLSYDFSASMTTAGSYTVTVTAKGTAGTYVDSEESVQSDPWIVTELATPAKPLLTDGIATWTAVPDENDGYRLQLYLELNNDGILVEAVDIAHDAELRYDFSVSMTAAGSYTVMVVAKGTGKYADSEPSEPSDPWEVTELAQPAKPSLSNGIAHWTAVDNENSGYRLQLYNCGDDEGEAVDVAHGAGLSYDFSARMTIAGRYTVAVIAKGTRMYADSVFSVPSDPWEVTELDTPAQPSLIDGTATWTAVDNENNGYSLQLYKDGESEGAAVDIAHGAELSYDFTTDMVTEGSYTVTVTAKGTAGVYADSRESDQSAPWEVTELDTPAQPSLIDGIATWTAVDNENNGYRLRLYKDGTAEGDVIDIVDIAHDADLSHDFSTDMVTEGSYTVTVTAIGTAGIYADSEESNPSDPPIVIEKLPTPEKPVWEPNGTATWTGVDNENNGYRLQLYKDEVEEGSAVLIAHGDPLSYDFSASMTGAGSYTVTVTAKGTAAIYADSDSSVQSEPQTVTEQLTKPEKPVWEPNGTATWTAVANENNGYSLQLYKDGVEEGAAVVVAHGDPLSYDFSASMTGAANYTVTVTAKGTEYYLDSDPSDESDIAMTDTLAVETDKTALELTYGGTDSASRVTCDLTLPTHGDNGTTTTWSSSNTSVITNTGDVSRPSYYSGNASVTLTATISKGTVLDTREFVLTVIRRNKPAPKPEPKPEPQPEATPQPEEEADGTLGSEEQQQTTTTEQTEQGEIVTVEVTVTPAAIEGAVEAAKQKQEPVLVDMASAITPPEQQEGEEPVQQKAKLTLSKEQVEQVADTGLAVKGPEGTQVELPKALLGALAKGRQDLNIEIGKVSIEDAREHMEQDDTVYDAKDIDTNFSGETKLRFTAPPDANPEELKIKVIHSDGTIEEITPTFGTDEEGNSYLEFTVDKFSTFIVYKPAEEEKPTKQIALTIDKVAATINGEHHTLDAAPFIKASTNRTLVPVRFVSEVLGAEVEWVSKTREVHITNEGKQIILTIDSDVVLVDEAETQIDSPAEIVGSRTFVPLRFVSETLGAEVEYKSATKEIVIVK